MKGDTNFSSYSYQAEQQQHHQQQQQQQQQQLPLLLLLLLLPDDSDWTSPSSLSVINNIDQIEPEYDKQT
ncbi:hypothetical protein ANO14919_031230 [Xylariales sp. No.14919]|nr:hypothetical protein ANO14919_031230 [Xylariales sp. No.14919]